MTILNYHKPGPRFFCRKCKADTPHYLRANGETAVCLSCDDEIPVRQLVKIMPLTHGGPERRV